MRRLPVLVGCALLLPLAGCAASSPVTHATASGPPAFPRVPGTVLAEAQAAPGDWTLRVRVTDAVAAYARARALLTAKGYQLTSDEPVSDGGHGQACTTVLCVSFAALTEPGEGPVVEYEAFHSTGLVG